MNLRTSLAKKAVLQTASASRHLGLGGGSMIGGRLGLAIAPGLLGELAHNRSVALISGTNGKTTTTRLLVESLGGPGTVATSLAGANMPAGLVTALAQAAPNTTGALEVDENYLPAVVRAVRPEVVVLLNLSRDQLDRVSEVRSIADKWRKLLDGSSATVVANADDPLVVYAAGLARLVIWVGAGNRWLNDAGHCPACDRHLDYPKTADPTMSPNWSCACGLARPEPDASLDDDHLVLSDGRTFPIELSLPGRFNRANTAMAALAASAFGVDIADALQKMSTINDIAGRFRTITIGETTVRLLLAKNPAGWNELIDLVRNESHPTMIAINAQIADGNDPSWLWDVPFERLCPREVLATGERRLDLAVRLRHAGLAHRVVDDPIAAINCSGTSLIEFIGNYTAFQAFRHDLDRRRDTQNTNNELSQVAIEPLPVVTSVMDDIAQVDPDDVLRDSHELEGRSSPSHVSVSRGARHFDISVVNIFPDLLGTYGDGGNARIVANRALWRGISVELIDATSDRPIPKSADIYCLGGGEDGPQQYAAACLRDGTLSRAVARGAVVLGVCAGYQIIGESFRGSQGIEHAGVGLLDIKTEPGNGPRSVGEVRAVALDSRIQSNQSVLSGFENHAGWTRRGQDVEPFATIDRGNGNGFDKTDGAFVGKVLGTYLHGPLLARNPVVADLLLSLATGAVLSALDDEEELALRSKQLRATDTSRWRKLGR